MGEEGISPMQLLALPAMYHTSWRQQRLDGSALLPHMLMTSFDDLLSFQLNYVGQTCELARCLPGRKPRDAERILEAATGWLDRLVCCACSRDAFPCTFPCTHVLLASVGSAKPHFRIEMGSVPLFRKSHGSSMLDDWVKESCRV